MYVSRFNNMLATVAASAQSTILSSSKVLTERSPEYFKIYCDSIVEDSGYVLPDQLIAGTELSGSHFNWCYEVAGNRQGGGEFSLSDFIITFCGGDMNLGSESDLQEIRSIKNELRVIDEHPETSDDQFAAFRLQGPDKMPPEIWYWNRGVIFKMNITYNQYLDALLDLKGINYWHFLFVDIERNEYYDKYYDKAEYEHICNKLEERINDLEFLFAKVELLKYRQLLVELTNKVSDQFD